MPTTEDDINKLISHCERYKAHLEEDLARLGTAQAGESVQDMVVRTIQELRWKAFPTTRSGGYSYDYRDKESTRSARYGEEKYDNLVDVLHTLNYSLNPDMLMPVNAHLIPTIQKFYIVDRMLGILNSEKTTAADKIQNVKKFLATHRVVETAFGAIEDNSSKQRAEILAIRRDRGTTFSFLQPLINMLATMLGMKTSGQKLAEDVKKLKGSAVGVAPTEKEDEPGRPTV